MFVTVFVMADCLRLRAPYEAREVCKSIAGARWNRVLTCWEYPRSGFILEAILQAFHNHGPLDAAAAALLQEHRAALANGRSVLEASSLPDIPVTKTKPWRHQLQAYWFAHPLKGAMLMMAMGTGKTAVAINLIVNRGHRRTLVLCPLKVVPVWPQQADLHAGRPLHVCALTDGTMKEKAAIAQAEIDWAERHGQPIIIVNNYDASFGRMNETGEKAYDAFEEFCFKAKFDLVICDESHRIKQPGGRLSRFCSRLGQTVPYRLALTGTPLFHSPMDVYAQMRYLDPGLFGTSFAAFRSRYAVMGGYQNHQVVRYQNLDDLHHKMFAISFRVDKDVLDLPPMVPSDRTCTLGAKARAIYDEFEEELIVQVENGVLTADNALVKLLRLQQLAGGWLKPDEGEIRQVDLSKLDLLQEILEDLPDGEPVVVFCRFLPEIAAIQRMCAEIGRPACELSGSRNDLAAWQAGKGQVLVVQIKAGGVGIDLTRAHYTFFYSLSWSLGEYQQAISRLHRPGQKETTFVYHLVAKESVDEQIMKALSRGANVVEYVLRELTHKEEKGAH